jgi:hypothetical protein
MSRARAVIGCLLWAFAHAAYATTFDPPVDLTASDRILSLTAGDLDGDGDADLVVAGDGGAPTIGWLENLDGRGQSMLLHPVETSFTGDAWATAVGDLDGDGDLDIIGDERVYLQQDGTWEPQDLNQGGELYLVEAADVDGDGDLDVVARRGASIVWFVNDGGDATDWTTEVTITSGSGITFALADLDGDGDVDLATATPWDDEVAVHFNDGSGLFWTEVVLATDVDNASDIVVADLDGDGGSDLLAAAEYDEELRAWHGDGAGGFSDAGVLGESDATSLSTADVNGDGVADVLAVGTSAAWWISDGTAHGELLLDEYVWADAGWVFDLDGDGHPEALVSTERDDDQVLWHYTDPVGLGTTWVPDLLSSDLDDGTGLLTVDLDLDGDLDVVGTGQTRWLVWWENAERVGSVWMPHPIHLGSSLEDAVAADFDGDGDIDLISADASGGDDLVLHLNLDGVGRAWSSADIGSLPNDASDLAAPDLNGDGVADLAVAIGSADEVSAWINDLGDGTLWSEILVDGADSPQELAHGDFDGDGDTDLAAVLDQGGELLWYENLDGGGLVWAPHTAATWFVGPTTVAAGDLDGDGDLDLVSGSNWYANDGTGGGWTPHDVGGYTILALAVGDVDGDGDLDVATSYEISVPGPDGRLGICENTDGLGTLLCASRDEVEQAPGALDLGDLDADGDTDVVGTLSELDIVAWWPNTAASPGPEDADGDSVSTRDDVCPSVADPAQIDGDGDGLGAACDCDDANPNVYPGAPEQCDGVDSDCDGWTDEHDDADGDGYTTCGADGVASTADDDCDDVEAAIHPDALETPYNGRDDDCDAGTPDDDLDRDGFPVAEDCDDEAAEVSPGASEVPGNGIDDDCDPSTSDAITTGTTGTGSTATGTTATGTTATGTTATGTTGTTITGTGTSTATTDPGGDTTESGPSSSGTDPDVVEEEDGGAGCGCNGGTRGGSGALLGLLLLAVSRSRSSPRRPGCWSR